MAPQCLSSRCSSSSSRSRAAPAQQTCSITWPPCMGCPLPSPMLRQLVAFHMLPRLAPTEHQVGMTYVLSGSRVLTAALASQSLQGITAWAAAVVNRPIHVSACAQHRETLQHIVEQDLPFTMLKAGFWSISQANGAAGRGVRACCGLQELLCPLLTLQVAARRQHSATGTDQPSAPLRQCRVAACQQRVRIAWVASLLTPGMYALGNAHSSMTHQSPPQMASLLSIGRTDLGLYHDTILRQCLDCLQPCLAMLLP